MWNLFLLPQLTTACTIANAEEEHLMYALDLLKDNPENKTHSVFRVILSCAQFIAITD